MRRDESPLWIFGYGSLLWRPDFPHEEAVPGSLIGWSRRFWQASPDHRGVPAAPGRVVTLIPEPGAECLGLAYRVPGDEERSVLARLDERESGGFRRTRVSVRVRAPARAGGESEIAAVTWVAGADNANFLGPAPVDAMVAQMRSARGRSGSNAEYVERLAEALSSLGAADEHVFGLARRLRAFAPEATD